MENVSGFWLVFGYGVLGGFLVELLRWWKLRESKELPIYSKHMSYWIITITMIIVGGIVGCLYGLENRNPITVIQLGASAPALISAFASKSYNENELDLLKTQRKKHSDPKMEFKKHKLSKFRNFLTFNG